MKVYLDNNVISYLQGYEEGRIGAHLWEEVEALVEILARNDVEVIVSDESRAEIERLGSPKREKLKRVFFKLKEKSRIIRNAGARWDDGLTYWDSEDARWDHAYDNADLNRVKSFLESRGNADEMDARYIANAMLRENQVDVFLTNDKKTILRHREDIEKLFGVIVKAPSELLAELSPAAE